MKGALAHVMVAFDMARNLEPTVSVGGKSEPRLGRLGAAMVCGAIQHPGIRKHVSARRQGISYHQGRTWLHRRDTWRRLARDHVGAVALDLVSIPVAPFAAQPVPTQIRTPVGNTTMAMVAGQQMICATSLCHQDRTWRHRLDTSRRLVRDHVGAVAPDGVSIPAAPFAAQPVLTQIRTPVDNTTMAMVARQQMICVTSLRLARFSRP